MTRGKPTSTPTVEAAPELIDEQLARLEATAFAHPYDRAATAALKRIKGFDRVVGKLLEWQHERRAHVELTSNSIRVTENQLPAIHELLADACQILDMEQPELYVTGGAMNAYTSGHKGPYIVLFTDLVDSMTDRELQAVIAHELGHIKCSHVLYKEMARWLAQLGAHTSRGMSPLSIAVRLALPLVRRALTSWDQRSELSADRAAMLVVQDEDVCLRMLLKLAGAPARFGTELDTAAFLEQAQRVHELTVDNFIARHHRRRLRASRSHPLTVERAHELHRWIEEGGYQEVRAQHNFRRAS